KPDHEIMYLFAKKFGFADEMFKNIEIKDGVPVIEDVLREINRGAWSIGYTGQSPERLKRQLENKHTFDTTTLRAKGGPCDGEYYGLPWPCWCNAEMEQKWPDGKTRKGHPGTHILYRAAIPVVTGRPWCGARCGTAHRARTWRAGQPGTRHPGTRVLYRADSRVVTGGLCCRARFGTEHSAESLLADGSYPELSAIKDGYPEFSYGLLRKLGWHK